MSGDVSAGKAPAFSWAAVVPIVTRRRATENEQCLGVDERGRMDVARRLYYPAEYINNSSGGVQTVFNKKILFTALLAVAGYIGYKRVRAERAEQDLWAEATDPVQPRDLR